MNPPAFPRSGYDAPNGDGWRNGQEGMSLRDYFAAAALTGIIVRAMNDASMTLAKFRDGCSVDRSQYAECAYQYADAMLAERSR